MIEKLSGVRRSAPRFCFGVAQQNPLVPEAVSYRFQR
jgi:hypothetical protein